MEGSQRKSKVHIEKRLDLESESVEEWGLLEFNSDRNICAYLWAELNEITILLGARR